jgi:hypothetical protein
MAMHASLAYGAEVMDPPGGISHGDPSPKSVSMDPPPVQPTLYAPLIPAPVPVRVDGPTGFLTVSDDPFRTGVLQGVLDGLAFPGIPGSTQGFLVLCGPDHGLTSEAQTAVELRERVGWIERALGKAADPSDRERLASLLPQARDLVADAERASEDVISEQRRWEAKVVSAARPARTAARVLRAAACLGFAFLAGGGWLAMAFCGLAAFLLIGIAARLAHRLRFDRTAAHAIKGRLYADRFERTGSRVANLHARGL